MGGVAEEYLPPELRCPDVELPEKYRVKRCKYCRAFSHQKSPFDPDVFPSWDGLIPWNDGKKFKPKGCICKICALVGDSFASMSDL